MPKKAALEFENVYKIYKNGTQAVSGLSFTVEEGEFFALLGPNGAGKTSLITIMAGPSRKTDGKIKVMGLDIEENREETKKLLGIVPQEISFDSFFTVNEVLQLQSGYYGVKDNQERIDDILENLGLKDKKHSNTRALSGGMKRRLLIAKALVHQPKVLILDEPTAGVDVELRHTLWTYMRRLNKEGLTILLTTHYLEEAESLCKRTAIIDKGKLVALDETQKLIRSMGSGKTMTISFSETQKHIPSSLKKFDAKLKNHHDITLNFDNKELPEVLAAIQGLKDLSDISLAGQSLEDVFIQLTYRSNE